MAAPETFKLETRQEGSAVVAVVAGSAGMAEAEGFRARLEQIADGETPLIVLDLSGLEFVCSAALAAMISAHLRVRRRNGQVRLANPRPTVRELLEITRLTKLFGVYDTVEKALAK